MSVCLCEEREGRAGEAGAVQEPLRSWQVQRCSLLLFPLPSIRFSPSQAHLGWKDGETLAHSFVMEWRAIQAKNKLAVSQTWP